MDRTTVLKTGDRAAKGARAPSFEQIDKLVACSSPTAANQVLVGRSGILTFLILDRRTFTQEQVVEATKVRTISIQNWINRGMLGDDIKKGIKASRYQRRMYRTHDLAALVLALALISKAGVPAASAFAHALRIVLAIRGLAIYDEVMLERLVAVPDDMYSFCKTDGRIKSVLENADLVFTREALLDIVGKQTGVVLHTGGVLKELIHRVQRLS